MPSVYINKIAKFLPNEPIENDEMELVLGKIANKPSRVRRIILRSNGIKQRYYAIDKAQNICYNNAELTAHAVRNLKIDLDSIETLACGTGMAACFYSANQSGKLGDFTKVYPTSKEELELRLSDEKLYFKGKVSKIFDTVVNAI